MRDPGEKTAYDDRTLLFFCPHTLVYGLIGRGEARLPAYLRARKRDKREITMCVAATTRRAGDKYFKGTLSFGSPLMARVRAGVDRDTVEVVYIGADRRSPRARGVVSL